MTEWPSIELADYPVEIIDGDRGSEYPKTADFSSRGYCLFLNAGNVTANGFSFDQCAFISQHRDQRLRKGKLQRHDVVLTTRGTVGNLAFYDESVPYDHIRINSGMVIFRTDAVRLEPRFFYFAAQSPTFREQIRSLTSGSAQPQLPIRDIRHLTLPLPPLCVQQAIVGAVGALQDKVELSRRTNETLEAMAQAIFRDWFVDFGPTRRKIGGAADPFEIIGGLVADPERARELAELFPAQLGDCGLPEGWENKPLHSIGSIVTGKTPSTRMPEFYGSDVPFLKIPDMHGKMYVIETQNMLSTSGAATQSKQTVPTGSVSVSCIATPGLVVLNHRAVQTNQQINSVIPLNSNWSLFLFWSCRRLSSEVMSGGSGGSVFNNMNKSTFGNLTVIWPGDSVAGAAFGDVVSPMHEMILANCLQNRTLAATRDLLLPKLMSGQVRLRDAEAMTEAAE